MNEQNKLNNVVDSDFIYVYGTCLKRSKFITILKLNSKINYNEDLEEHMN